MLIALCLPFHTVNFFSLGALSVGALKVFTFMASGTFDQSDFCLVIKAFNPELDICREVQGSHGLQTVSARFCASNVERVFKNGCSAFSNAYTVGMAVIILCMINLMLQGVATWMLYYYMYTAPKKKYREVSLILVIVGTSLVALSLFMYLPLVTMQLNNIEVTMGISVLIEVNKNNGLSMGYTIMCVAIMFQVIQIVLYKHSKISEERRLVELKMQEQFEAELAVGGGAGGFDAYGGGYGGDPYGQQQQGYGQQAMPGSYGAYPAPGPPMPMSQPAYGQSPGYGPGYGAGYY